MITEPTEGDGSVVSIKSIQTETSWGRQTIGEQRPHDNLGVLDHALPRAHLVVGGIRSIFMVGYVGLLKHSARLGVVDLLGRHDGSMG
jgi:hypothetical protein